MRKRDVRNRRARTIIHAAMLLLGMLAACLVPGSGCGGRSATGDESDGAARADADINREIGKCCDDSPDCTTRHCIFFVSSGHNSLCAKPCGDNDDCPALSGCQRLGNGRGGFYSMCLPCELLVNTNPRTCANASETFRCFAR